MAHCTAARGTYSARAAGCPWQPGCMSACCPLVACCLTVRPPPRCPFASAAASVWPAPPTLRVLLAHRRRMPRTRCLTPAPAATTVRRALSTSTAPLAAGSTTSLSRCGHRGCPARRQVEMPLLSVMRSTPVPLCPASSTEADKLRGVCPGRYYHGCLHVSHLELWAEGAGPSS